MLRGDIHATFWRVLDPNFVIMQICTETDLMIGGGGHHHGDGARGGGVPRRVGPLGRR